MIRITDATEADISAIAEIENECFTDPWSVESFTEAFGDNLTKFLCAFDGDELCGYILFRSIFDEGEILSIAVSTKFRRRGIARRLIDEAFSYAKEKEVTDVFLEVRESNIGAISLYESFGFCEIGRRRNYYVMPRENAIVMHCVL